MEESYCIEIRFLYLSFLLYGDKVSLCRSLLYGDKVSVCRSPLYGDKVPI